MSKTSCYCPHCGAVNLVESQICFACQSPLAHGEEHEQEILLNDRYQILTQVGVGGFGGVYQAIDTAEFSRIVAVKQINLHGLSAQEAIEATDSFHRELRLLSALHHPNLPVIRDTFTDAEHWYLVMDFIEGLTLETYLQQGARSTLPLDEVLDIGLRLCAVLNYLHTREPAIIFRDLKPSNVMRTASRQIFLIDFGIARHFTPGKPKDTAPFGSPGYAAPEQYGRTQTTPQADIYSLGALLHHLLTGNDPAESPFRFAPLPSIQETTLAELNLLIQRMVAIEPEERPNGITEVETILRFLSNQVQAARRQAMRVDIPSIQRPPIKVSVASMPTTRRHLLFATLTLAGTGGVIGLCAFAASQRRVNGINGVAVFLPPSPGVVKQRFVYTGHKGAITALSWSPDGTMVASGSADKTVQVWRSSDGVLLYTLVGYSSPVTSVIWATNRKNVIASGGQSDGTIQIWDALCDHQYQTFHGDGRVLALAWQANSPWVASAGTDREIYTWNAETGVKGTGYHGHKGEVRALTWLDMDVWSSPDPSGVVETGQVVSGGADGTVQIWRAQNGQPIFTYTRHTAGINGLATIQLTPNQQRTFIVSASDDGTVQIWEPQSATSYISYKGHQGEKVNAVTVLPPLYYYRLIASAGDDHTVQVWTQYAHPTLIYSQHQAPVKALAASPVDKRIVSGDEHGQVHLWTVTGLNR